MARGRSRRRDAPGRHGEPLRAPRHPHHRTDAPRLAGCHEIRNPLTGIQSLAQRLSTEDLDDAKRRRYADVIVTESRRVESLLGTLLGIARRAPAVRADVSLADIIPLAIHFMTTLATRDRRAIPQLSNAARAALLRHRWPGNIRELRNAIERALVMTTGDTLDVAGLPPEIAGPQTPFRAIDAALAGLPFAEARDRAVDQFSREMLTAALERHAFNVSETARALGLHRQSLQKMMRRLGIAGR